MNNANRFGPRIIAALACVVAATASVFAQAPPPPTDQPPPASPRAEEPPAEPAGPQARERLRAAIEAQLKAARDRQERLTRALKMLDEGEPLREIWRETGNGPWDRADGGRAGPPGADARLDGPGFRPDQMGPGGPGGGPGGPGGPPAGAQSDLGPDQIKPLMEVLADTNPRLHERLSWLLEHEPAMGRAAIVRAAPRLRELAQLRDRDPEAYGLKKQEIGLMRQAFDALRALHDMPAADRTPEKIDATRAQLAQIVNEQFALRMEIRDRELKQAEDRLEKIHAEIDAASTNRDELVQQRVDDMMRRALEGPMKGPPGGDDDGAGPSGPPGGQPGGPLPGGRQRQRFRDRTQPPGGTPQSGRPQPPPG